MKEHTGSEVGLRRKLLSYMVGPENKERVGCCFFWTDDGNDDKKEEGSDDWCDCSV